jgi:hypothetical protein
MFGCGLPVAAKGFPALPELVKDGINGTIFNSPEELANQVPIRQKVTNIGLQAFVASNICNLHLNIFVPFIFSRVSFLPNLRVKFSRKIIVK